MKRLILAVLSLGLLAGWARTEGRWILQTTRPTIATILTRGVEGPGTYLYMITTITNATEGAVPLNLRVDVATDVPNLSLRGAVDPLVRKAVQRRTGRKLVAAYEVGEIEPGDSVDVIFTFGKLDARVDRMTFQIVGLVDRVYTDRGAPKVQDLALRVDASRRGDDMYRQRDEIRVHRREWVELAPAVDLR